MKQRALAVLPVVLDLIVPTIGYYVLHAAGLSDVWALTIAGSASAVMTLGNTIRRRRLDLLGALIVLELAVSVFLAFSTHDPKLVLARASLYLAIAGLFFLSTAIAGRPVTYGAATPMATKGDPVRLKAYSAAWDNSPELRRIHTRVTAIIGVLLLVYAVLRLIVIYKTSVAEAVWAQEVPGIAMLVLVILTIRVHVPKLRRIVDAEQQQITAEPAVATAPASPTPA
jgi:hypothetical protein